MYQAEPDPYCYDGTDVLKNRAEIRSQDALDTFETAMTFARSEEPLPTGRFTARHYGRLHHHLFQDVYVWAGKYRTVRMSKGDNAFCYPEYIDQEMQRVFANLGRTQAFRSSNADVFATAAAHVLAEINAIHPFREGNGRTQLTFLVLLGNRAGLQVDLDHLDPEAILDAMIRSFSGDERRLVRAIKRMIV